MPYRSRRARRGLHARSLNFHTLKTDAESASVFLFVTNKLKSGLAFSE